MKRNWKKWLNYRFDDYISKGLKAQVVLLMSAIGIMVLIFGILIGIVSAEYSIGTGTWQALLHMLDQGTIGGDGLDDKFYVGTMLFVTLLGMAFTGTIVGIINNAMGSKLDELKKGHSQIIEEGHVVVIGFDENIHTILKELDESCVNYKGNRTVVVIDNMDKEEMEFIVNEHKRTLQKIDENGFLVDEEDGRGGLFGKNKRTRFIFRSGDVVSENTYAVASLEKARAIIINKEEDFEVIRVILSLVCYLKKCGVYFADKKLAKYEADKRIAEFDKKLFLSDSDKRQLKYAQEGRIDIEEEQRQADCMPSIVTLMHEKENVNAAAIAAGVYHEDKSEHRSKAERKVRILYFEDILAHIFAQVCRQPGLSWVLAEIFDYDDSEIYIEDTMRNGSKLDDKLVGKNFEQVCEMVTNSVAIGIQRGEQIILNPDPQNMYFEKGDKLIHIAETDNILEVTDNGGAEPFGDMKEHEEYGNGKYNFLIFGWSVPLLDTLGNIDMFADKGSRATIITNHERQAEDIENACLYKNVKVTKKKINPYDWGAVKNYLEKRSGIVWEKGDESLPTNIVIMCQDGIDKVEADEKAAVLLINIREFLRRHDVDNDITITTEMNLPEDQRLLQHTSTNDFIVGSEIANRMMVQVANNPYIYSVFNELLNDYGSEIYLRDFSDYVDITKPFNFKMVEKSARIRGFGYDPKKSDVKTELKNINGGEKFKKNYWGNFKQEIVLGWLRTGTANGQPEVHLNLVGDAQDKEFVLEDGLTFDDCKVVVLAIDKKEEWE